MHRAPLTKEAETSRSFSALVNEAVELSLAEDIVDLAAFYLRAGEPILPFEADVKELRGSGRI